MNPTTRRLFLEQSMLSTAAALALASRSSLATEPQQPPSLGPNDTIQVAIVGAGGRGQSHIDGFAGKPGTVVTHICDCDEKAGQRSCESAAEKQGGRKPIWVRDIRKLLEDPSIHAVSIATPNHWHSLGAIWAIQAGKDVYVEKPVSHNVLEGRRVVQAARKHQRIVQTGTQSRSNPGMREAIEFIHSGGIGDVAIARGLCYKRRESIGPRGNFEVPKEVDYDLWSGPARILPLTRQRFHYDWHWQWEYGNGDLGNQGIHQMDLCRWALGEDRLGDRVWSFGGRYGYVDAGETANTQVVVHDYGAKKLIFEVRGLPTKDFKGANVGIIVEGSKGYLVMTSYASGTAFDLDGKPITQFNGGGDEKHYKNFTDAMRSRDHKKLNADIEQGHWSSALCHLGNISLRLGENTPAQEVVAVFKARGADEAVLDTWNRTADHLADNDITSFPLQIGPQLQLDPRSESFAGPNAPNQWLTREYRAPYTLPSEDTV
jgi:predicted dehydrogenase